MKIVVAGSQSFRKNIRDYYASSDSHEIIYLDRSSCDFADSIEFSSILSDIKPDLLLHTAVSLTDTNNNIAMYLALEKFPNMLGKQ